MDKEAYFIKSKAQGLPNRCPILEHCVRRMFTLYFYGDYKETDPEVALSSYLPTDFKVKAIGYFGEAPVWQAARDRMHGYFNGMCPEVNLFDHEHQLHGMEGSASVGGTWDYEGELPVSRLEYKHFSECSEFSKHAFDKISKGGTRRPRPKRTAGLVSQKLRFEIFQRDKFTCQYCNRNKEDGIKLQLDHRVPIRQGGTDDISNLITACYDCNQGKSDKVIQPLP